MSSIAYSVDFLADLRLDSLVTDECRFFLHSPPEPESRFPLRPESDQEHLSLLRQRLRSCPAWVMAYAVLTLEGYDNDDIAVFLGLSKWTLEYRIREYREGHIRAAKKDGNNTAHQNTAKSGVQLG